MATAAQIQANRANAQNSTGPRTPEGKARVSQNACLKKELKTGTLHAMLRELGFRLSDLHRS